jgi:hypothetical protein
LKKEIKLWCTLYNCIVLREEIPITIYLVWGQEGKMKSIILSVNVGQSRKKLLNPNLDGSKKGCSCAAGSYIWLPGDQYEAGRIPCEIPSPSTLTLATWESYMSPSQPPQKGGSSYFLIEKSPKTAFLENL